ncbi:MAG: TIGR00730 family Rossman fold protein [Gammaproteobacteria bacterium]|nr:MAG: TIGR00730 family Rossman fold protein [Gammaproteobacteria bacterium]
MIDDLKGDESWRMFRIISEFTEGFDKLATLGFAVSIFGSARLKPDDEYYQHAVKISRMLGEQGFNIITGGGPGIMEAANKGASEAGVKSVGLNIELPMEQQPNKYQNESLEYRYFFARKVMFVKYSLGYVCLPGGFGTFDEFFEALALIQTRKIYPLPLVLFGKDYWQGLIDWMQSAVLVKGTISPADFNLITITDDSDEVVDLMVKHRQWKQNQIQGECDKCDPVINHPIYTD